MPAKDVNLTAVFEPVVYQITYDLDGGKEYYNPTSYTYESNTIVLNRPTKSHYEFLGWSEEGKEGLVKDVTIPKGSYGKRHFKANWKHARKHQRATNFTAGRQVWKIRDMITVTDIRCSVWKGI